MTFHFAFRIRAAEHAVSSASNRIGRKFKARPEDDAARKFSRHSPRISGRTEDIVRICSYTDLRVRTSVCTRVSAICAYMTFALVAFAEHAHKHENAENARRRVCILSHCIMNACTRARETRNGLRARVPRKALSNCNVLTLMYELREKIASRDSAYFLNKKKKKESSIPS